MLRRILTAFIICIIALGGLTLRDRIQDLQEQLDRVDYRISYDLLSTISKVSSSVVYVEAAVDDCNDSYGWIGSGVIIGPHTVLTAEHVITDANNFTITTVDGNDYAATNWVIDPNNDCGLLFFEEELGPIAKLTDSNNVKIGDKVIVIGSPYGFFNTVTTGIVSGLNREILYFGKDPLFTVDAASWSGNSGGPVFNVQGQIIGILVGGTWDGDNFSIVTSANICRKLYETATEIKSQTD